MIELLTSLYITNYSNRNAFICIRNKYTGVFIYIDIMGVIIKLIFPKPVNIFVNKIIVNRSENNIKNY